MSHAQPGIHGDDLSSESPTLVGSGIERFTNDEESVWEQPFVYLNPDLRLEYLREQMAKSGLDY